jgi:hypothetical protein
MAIDSGRDQAEAIKLLREQSGQLSSFRPCLKQIGLRKKLAKQLRIVMHEIQE